MASTNGGHVQGEDFPLDLEGSGVDGETLKEMIVDSMKLARAGAVTLYNEPSIRRGEQADAVAE